MRSSIRLLVLLSSSLVPAVVEAAEPTQFVAVHRVGETNWVELQRSEEADAGGRTTVLFDDDFLHALRRALPGARPLGTPVRLVAETGATCDGTLGRPARLGLYFGDEGYGGEPVWLRAAPVRGCSEDGYRIGVLRPSAASVIGIDDDARAMPAALVRVQARTALVTSPTWLPTRMEWARTYAYDPASSEDRVFDVGGTSWGLASDHVPADCGTVFYARALVRRTADGAYVTVPFPGSETEDVVMLGDLDGDGAIEIVLAGFPGLRILRFGGDGEATQVWSNDGIPFFGCPC